VLLVVDPFGVTPPVVALVEHMEASERRRTIRRAVAVATGLAVFFLVAGRARRRSAVASPHPAR